MSPAPVLRAALDRAIGRAEEALLARQDAAGSWTDWALPPGPSSEWTTAHVGHCLARHAAAQGARVRPDLARALAQAAAWLRSHRFPDGGWGYNPAVPSDADSTALAILFLSATAGPVPEDAHRHLRSFQQPDGGFATFRPDGLTGSWGRSHPEITAIALLALLARPAPSGDPAIARAVAWLRRARRGDGCWNAFWWATGLGATDLGLAVLASVGCPQPAPPALRSLTPADSLQSALLLSCLARTGWPPQARALAGRLIADQAADGTWQGAPALRITRRECDSPWDSPDPGPLFADPRRTFTTATVLAALSAARAALSQAAPGER